VVRWLLLPALARLALCGGFDDVKPLLDRKCTGCHGAAAALHGLRLDTREAALKGGDSGVPAIVPGNSAASLLIRYVSGQDKEIVMPPAGPRLSEVEIRLLRDWIDSEQAVPPQTERPKGYDHWAFQPILKPEIPPVRRVDWVRTPIDAFVLSKLEAKGWRPGAPAKPHQLLRRVFFDLTGLPPTLAEQDSFARSPDLDAVTRDLLGRSTYGERWGRHWLDLVRYAESNGYERDGAKPEAYKYRDYVIRAFNGDKPFDRFIAEQLAGDELDDAAEESLIATGYNRLGPWDDEPADPAEDRFDQLEDIVSTTSQVFLGLTLGCARCHNHKFDPLTAQDYYSMVAIFNGLERPRRGRTELTLPVGPLAAIERERARDARVQHHAAAAAAQAHLLGYPLRAPLDEIAAIKKSEPDLPRGYFMHEPAAPPVTHLLVRGKAARPGPAVVPAVPAVLVRQQPEFPSATGRTAGRRLTLARWLARRDNPLTARVIVNRVWQFHFGEGLVRTPSDFGMLGQRPTHPELLDWLAVWFVDNGWSFKKLHTLILSSNVYRMSKLSNETYAAADPENRLLWRLPYRRLEAEAIRDSMLAVSGRLNPKMYGPSMFPEVPEAAMAGSSDPDKIWKASDEQERSRRTVYAFLKRSLIVPMLEVLDLCDTARTSAQRLTTSVAPQALTLFNGEFVNAQSRRFAERLRREGGADPARQVELAYRLALARRPTPAESVKMLRFLDSEPLEQLTRVILNLNEFVYTD
jgi:cytochrome c553